MSQNNTVFLDDGSIDDPFGGSIDGDNDSFDNNPNDNIVRFAPYDEARAYKNSRMTNYPLDDIDLEEERSDDGMDFQSNEYKSMIEARRRRRKRRVICGTFLLIASAAVFTVAGIYLKADRTNISKSKRTDHIIDKKGGQDLDIVGGNKINSVPTVSPTFSPTLTPTSSPSQDPSSLPSELPSSPPTNTPSFSPSQDPSSYPSISPTLSFDGNIRNFFINTFGASHPTFQPDTDQNSAFNYIVEKNPLGLVINQDLHVIETSNKIIQTFALATLYYAMGGQNWSVPTWMDATDPCTPDIVMCNDKGMITSIILDGVGIDGYIPPEIGLFSKIRNLIVKNNPKLKSNIPSEIGNLLNLKQLGLYNNQLSGSIPKEICDMSNIEFIDLSDNNIDGKIPTDIGNLLSLEKLFLDNNKISGNLNPFEIRELKSLKVLSLSNNNIEGKLIHAFHHITGLEYLYLDNNKIRGTLPNVWDSLTNLKSLTLNNNELYGPFAPKFKLMESLNFFTLNDNQITGSIPTQIGWMTEISTLNFSNNLFNSTIPFQIKKLSNMKELQLHNNELTGQIPDEVEHLTKLEILTLSSNNLDGTLPSTLSELKNSLRELHVSDNNLTGRMKNVCPLKELGKF